MNNKEIKYPSRDLTYEWGRTAPEQLSKEASLLDTKILGILFAANIIIGVMVALAGKIQFDLTLIPFSIASIAFLIIFMKSLLAYRTRRLYVCDSPEILQQDYWRLEPDEAKEAYWEFVKEDFKDNLEVVKIKGQAILLTVPLLAIEVVSLIVWVLLISY